jgi:hypothetical protein
MKNTTQIDVSEHQEVQPGIEKDMHVKPEIIRANYQGSQKRLLYHRTGDSSQWWRDCEWVKLKDFAYF